MAIRLQIRRDTLANWTSINPVLAQGELIEVLPEGNGPVRFKIGDGVHTWTELDYLYDASLLEKAVQYNGSTAVGSATRGVYVAADGTATAMTYELNKTVPADAAFTDDSAIWGNITGTLSNQADLQSALDGKVDELSSPATAGTYTKVTINSDGLVSSGTTLSASDIPDISATYYLASNPAGYTNNVGTVTSVNNVEPVNGNVTIEIPDTATWGNITGTLANQTDLQGALDNKVDKTTTADKVYGTDANGDQTTYDKNSFGQVDDVTVGGTSVVTNKIAVLGSMAGETASDYVLVSNIVNDVVSTDTDKPLSANMGKELQDQVDNLKARGRFLALWDCSTGLAETHPTVSPYEYKAGDYFIVGIVAQAGGTNYKPSGSSYTDNVPSTAIETGAVSVNDTYYYDGNVWHLQINTQKEIAFVNIAGDPYDNSNLASALNDKQDELPAQTGQSGKFLTTNGTAISWGDAPVTDVQINSTSILSSGVANIPKASTSDFGVAKINTVYGIGITANGELRTSAATDAEIESKSNTAKPLVPSSINKIVMEGLGNNSLTWTDAYKASARNTIGATQAVFVDWSD